MDFLELNIHQRILTDLAANVAQADQDAEAADIALVAETIASKVQTVNTEPDSEDAALERVYMTSSRVRCHIGFAELAASLRGAQVVTTVPILVQILQDVFRIEFDQSFSWDEWALPDQLVYSVVTSLLRIASGDPQFRTTVFEAIINFCQSVVEHLEKGSSFDVLTQFAPSFHGFYRAITSTTFPWTAPEWVGLSAYLNPLFATQTIERLNRLLVDVLQHCADDAERLRYIRTLLSRYVSKGRPLTGYFTVCCVIEAQWTVLAQLFNNSEVKESQSYNLPQEAEAADQAWLTVLKASLPLEELQLDQVAKNALKAAIQHAMQCFSELLIQIEEMEAEPEVDTYAWETLSESLKLASICCAVSQELDPDVLARLKLLLSMESPIWDMLVQEAALNSTIVVVRNFPQVAPSMIGHLRHFVTAPLPVFEVEFASNTRIPPPLIAAARCLALCIDVAPGDDLLLSNIYSLLNYIAAATKDIFESSASSNVIGLSQSFTSKDHATLGSMEAGLRGMTEEEKRLVGISTISVVTHLALEFKNAEVTRLTISMLLQRLRSVDPSFEAAIANNLVDLALVASDSSFVDIIRAFSSINRSANPDDPRLSNNMVLAAQTRLAQEIYRRPKHAMTYLVELLTLFNDNGVAIQNIASKNTNIKIESMVTQLTSLLLPIDALLGHEMFDTAVIAKFSPEVVTLFRNMWFLCILFHLTSLEQNNGPVMEWQRPALLRIALKSPDLVHEEARDSLSSDIEFNPVIRHEYVNHAIAKHRALLTKHVALRSSEIKNLPPGLIIFLLSLHDLETMRAAAGNPSRLASYFRNESLNKHPALSVCMESVADKVMRGSVTDLNLQASEQSLPKSLSLELQQLLVLSTHRVERVRDVASQFLNRLITSFPSLMCDPPLVIAILEVLTLMSRACEDEFTDEFNPIYEFFSERAGITLHLPDSYVVRNQILAQLERSSQTWFELALARAPTELQASLQKYLAFSQPTSLTDTADLGASVAEHFGKAISPGERQLKSLASLASWKADNAKTHISQLARKAFFAGESRGSNVPLDQTPTSGTFPVDSESIRGKMKEVLHGIRDKTSNLSTKDLSRLLFRCSALLVSSRKCDYSLIHYLVALPFEVFTISSVSTGIQAWSWVISEKPEFEVALMTEIVSAWTTSVKHERGMFSQALNYDDPFYQSIHYSPTNKEDIDRGSSAARRLVTPHSLILQMLLSRLQAARYRKPGLMRIILNLVLRSARAYHSISTHALAREARFSFLLFGFELLRGLHLDLFCENILREALYSIGFAWFSVRPQWSYGASRVQINADIKVLSEFLSYLQTDNIRGYPPISSLSPGESLLQTSTYLARLKTNNQLLRFLVEDEIYRLGVWSNPMNEAKRGTDYIGSTERGMTEASWTTTIRAAWDINPAIAVYLTERTKNPTVHSQVGKLVCSSTRSVLDIPEALRFVFGDSSVKRNMKHLLLWAAVPPIQAIACFQQADRKDSLVLQYAHRVLEQHPVGLVFFFVPQIVQALRYDELGYVERFIFETAKISQLFCHQIVWNMKANCYKDDAGEIEDSMKPQLDRMTNLVIASLSGEARAFYEKEFGFFDEVTSISGKLKPFIKKTKEEKKAKIDEEMSKIKVEIGVYLPSNPDGKVVDIDRKSGRPLQSHAKAPFMATFKVRKQREVIQEDTEEVIEGGNPGVSLVEYDVWLRAIFKVGDDCRQDVLALQIIAMFKNIFESVGLMLYLFPYRVTATAPGCGVIDVVPNATSRDEMGRAKVNDLLGFFVAKYGGEDTIAFQQARLNFIQSMAAYSVACYILQIKDRHNGNIMIDGEGHIVHIDFGFLFDIGPGGVKFEPSSFKLTHEMIVLMGGRASQGYALFQHLTVKAFLALRPHADQLVSTVQLMLDTGLPSFKGEGTIKRLRDRFALGLNERQAADFMVGIVRNAQENVRSTVYDEFQRLQNGIPYK